jgi:hypothetical protein
MHMIVVQIMTEIMQRETSMVGSFQVHENRVSKRKKDKKSTLA